MAYEIRTEEWYPQHPPLEYPKEFVAFIDSINKGWQNQIRYEPYELYKQQAQEWLKDEDTITDYEDEEEQEDFIIREYFRCRDNTLYFANKYGWLKEGDVDGGGISYKAWKAQELVYFLADCGYNLILGKARQIGFTSSLGLLADKRINFNKSYYCKFVTHTKEKGEEIFRDKIQWSFGRIPDWLRNDVYNFSHNMLSLRKKGKTKGETSGANSMVEVVTPAVDAINGGQPNLVLIDEIGLIPVFTRMMKEGRPALFFYNPANGKMEMKRQLIAWGTGGEMDKGGAVFEAEFKSAYHAWEDRNFDYGVIPLFFDCYAREGMTKEIYEKEKKYYYSITGAEAEISKVQFHQHYPLTLDDMFLRKSTSIVPVNFINKKILNINALKEDDKPVYGYFEPEYDSSQPTDDEYVPFKIVGVQFVPTQGMDDERTTCVLVRHPDKNWEYRYYQGTDPINSETGKSKMSSAIWDAWANTPVCVINWRIREFKYVYLQCLLMGMYYDQGTGTLKELVESNIGDMYVDFLDRWGQGQRIAGNADLPVFMQTPTSKWWGISNRTNTAGKITNKLLEMLELYADNIYVLWFWLQCKTFVEKPLKGQNMVRQSRFQAADLKYDFDDVIFSVDFSYICAEAFARYEPREINRSGSKRVHRRYVQNRDTNWKLKLAEVDDNGRVIKYIGRSSN
jgi:hypothetical protein